MKAMRDRVDEELVVIKLFASNYARDLFYLILRDEYGVGPGSRMRMGIEEVIMDYIIKSNHLLV